MNAPETPAYPSLSILVVEDDAETRNLLGLIIGRKFPGVTILSGEDGRAGLELFRKYRPSVVLTDVNMQGMDGIQMAREIRALQADAKLIVITAYSTREYLEEFNKIGFSAYITKPIVFNNLFAALENCFAELTPAQ